jgi:fermentation-respiration switch protein FrsA (DUF1100 family)
MKNCFSPLSVLLLIFLIEFMACTHPVRRLIFQPHMIRSAPLLPKDEKQIERYWLNTDQGDVEGWLFKGDGVDIIRKGPAVLMAHGNQELIDYYVNHAENYQRMGFTVLLGEYRGYGRSAGEPNRSRVGADFKRFYDHLISLPTVDPDRIVFHGRSLGGAVLSELSMSRPPASIIVESTFTSVKEMAYGAPDILLTDRYDSLAALKEFQGPILILHGGRDNVVPLRHALEIKRNTPHAELIVYNCGHNDCPPDWAKYWEDIGDFLERSIK